MNFFDKLTLVTLIWGICILFIGTIMADNNLYESPARKYGWILVKISPVFFIISSLTFLFS